MLIFGFMIIVLIGLSTAEDNDKKWVWEKNSRSNNLQRDEDGPRASARYEIFEPEGGDFDYDRPLRPRPHQGQGQGPFIPNNRPDYNRPPYPLPNLDPGFNGGVGGGGRPPIKKFDTCSCTEKFNCQSPGISYGHCDVGKSYCCFNKHGGLELGPAPNRPIQSPANGILVGPSNGGDFGYGRPDYDRPRPIYDRPYYGRPGYGGGGRPQGVLVGPGGPTGIIGRPGLGLRPNNGNGVLVGPGGPYDRPYGGGGGYNRPLGIYGRSADNDKKKNK